MRIERISRSGKSALHMISRLMFMTMLITAFILTFISKRNPVEVQQERVQTDCKTATTTRFNVSINDPKLALLMSMFNRSRCRIEVYGGFIGLEQAYISGTLFRFIRETCACYLHYQPIEKFSTISINTSNIARIVWCVLGCPKDVIQWCQIVKHRLYCQKHVVLFDLFDEYANSPIEHYTYMAAVYRNYLRHDSGNYVTYLTKSLRKLFKINDLKYIHQILNWTLAINVVRDEWRKAGLDPGNFLSIPSHDVLSQINHRITTRLMTDRENIAYHTWPNLDTEIRRSQVKKLPVFWFPIGYTPTYLYEAAQSSVGPLSQRKRLWTWIGSVKENERTDMVKRFEMNDTLADHIRQRGFLLITGPSNGGIVNMDYTSELLDSQFVPLPRGYSPEQYRSFEVLESGTIPIVNEHWLKIKENSVLEPLAYLNILGYDPPTLTNFSTLPEKLLELSRLPLDLLDYWQGIMFMRHKMIMETLSKHIAAVVCATTSFNGYIHDENQDN